MADRRFGEVSYLEKSKQSGQLPVNTLHALIAIAEELKRFNDREEAKLNISGFVMNINEGR